MIVVDASVFVTALVDSGRDGDVARGRLLEDGDLHAPHLADLEVASQLRRAVQEGALDGWRAEAALADLRDLRVARYPHTPFLERIWELRANLTPYDAAYVALGEALAAPLVTADARLARAPGIGCPVEVLR